MGNRPSKKKSRRVSVHRIHVDAEGPSGKIFKVQFDATFPHGTVIKSIRTAKRDPYEVLKMLAETNALLEESARMQVNNIVDKLLSFASEISSSAIRERLASVERVYRQEG